MRSKGAPLRRAHARIAGEFVRRRAWEPLGCVRPADSALARLPALDAALTAGRLGWTKARLLCRVATPEDEGHWLEAASRLPAAALAREVRAIDVGALEAGGAEASVEEGREREVLCVRAPRRVRTKGGVE